MVMEVVVAQWAAVLVLAMRTWKQSATTTMTTLLVAAVAVAVVLTAGHPRAALLLASLL